MCVCVCWIFNVREENEISLILILTFCWRVQAKLLKGVGILIFRVFNAYRWLLEQNTKLFCQFRKTGVTSSKLMKKKNVFEFRVKILFD